MPMLKFGLPKGSLQESTFSLLREAGWNFSPPGRSYYPVGDDPEVKAMLARPQEMSRYVERGVFDVAITGRDWTCENASDVEIVTELLYSKASLGPIRWALAVLEDSPIRDIKDLEGKVVATELVKTTERFFARHGVRPQRVDFSHGATEVKVPDLADAIVDCTETGSSFRANRLREITTVLDSLTVMIVNKPAWQDPWKREKISAIMVMLHGVLAAKDKILLKLNAPSTHLDAIVRALPALNAPTVNQLSTPGWHAVETIVDLTRARILIPQLKALGAQGLVTLSPGLVVP